jgi:hypothetical protein
VTVTPFLAQKIAEMADFTAFFTSTPEKPTTGESAALQGESLNEINARPAVTDVLMGPDSTTVTLPCQRTGMALTPAEKQKRYRERLKAADQTNPDAIERELLQEVAQEMSDQERIALAHKLADLAMDFQRRAIRLSRMATKLRTGEDHPLQR